MSTSDLTDTTAIVTGASRGFGRAVVSALHAAGARVVGVARGSEGLYELRDLLGDRFSAVAADATDPDIARDVIAEYRPRALILNAGAQPPMAPLHEHTWETFSRNWDVDTRHVFQWTRAALRLPLEPGSVVVAMSSGAALRGSPLSGGYAGAKSTIRFISSYAAGESERAALGIRFRTLLPQLTPATELGAEGVRRYAEREGVEFDVYAKNFQPVLTPDLVGQTVLDLVGDPAGPAHAELVVTGGGTRPVG